MERGNGKPIKIDMITMGCSKNLIDSERLMGLLSSSRVSLRHNPESVAADIAIVNTCGFIGDAKEESIDMIFSLVQAKKRGDVKEIYVMGCLSERYLTELKNEIPEVDAWYGKYDWAGIASRIHGENGTTTHRPWDRVLTTIPHSTYIKISEGCNRKCAFCAIPLITGPHHSRPVEEILEETAHLTKKGVKEFNVIAQDTSSYGLDLTHRQELPGLINRMADIPGVEWIRIHYAYPAQFPMDLLKVINERENVCKYLDIALQHISDRVLENMRRHISSTQTKDLIKKIRDEVPDIHLRTTLMVGFPGEGDKEFQELLDFVKDVKFERMGAFAYCEEENTFAAKKFKDEIPGEEKQRRLNTLMDLQQSISEEIQLSKIGNTYKTIIDAKDGEYYIGRTQWDSPEVDPEVMVTSSRPLNIGEFVNVKITDATAFELYGNVR